MKGFVQDYDIGAVAYAEHSFTSIPTGTSLFSLAFIAWLLPAAISSIPMEEDKRGVSICYARNVVGWLLCKMLT